MTGPQSPSPLWERNARLWQFIGPPLRPSAEDINFVASILQSLPNADADDALASILLGVTPELAAVLTATRMLSIDRSMAMIRGIGARHPRGPRARSVVADWRRMPVRGEIADLIAGDGCYTALDFPAGYRALSREVVRALKPAGRFVVRLFVSPERRETPQAVFDDLLGGRIGNFHIFKWRLAMAVQSRPEEGVRLGDIWTTWNSSAIDPQFLINAFGWPASAVGTIEAHCGVNERFTFPTLTEVRAILHEYFCELGALVPSYELGERCPSLVLEKRE